MKKSIIAVSAAAVIAGSVFAYTALAQQSPRSEQPIWHATPADIAAFSDARIAALHAGLALTPDQEKLWPPVEGVLKDMAKKRAERFEQRRAEREQNKGPVDPMVRLRRGAEFMTETGSDLKRLADASQPLYEKLDDAQKQRLQIMVRHGMHERFREHMMHRFGEWNERFQHWREGWMDHGHGPDLPPPPAGKEKL
ncbi:MAG TPA: Spy/CpxP family protein refolding chaperone [Xanthobacteraceae bacterium]|nr:Spy/CpxP family protein refolding chaperone [Xanthobacteraceae bacterium]